MLMSVKNYVSHIALFSLLLLLPDLAPPGRRAECPDFPPLLLIYSFLFCSQANTPVQDTKL